MKVLEAGTKKFLLLDAKEIERNAQRGRDGAPVVRVLEVLEDGTVARHGGYQLLTEGPVLIDYNQRAHIVLDYFPNATPRERIVRAAYMTTGKVLIAEDQEEAAVLVTTATPVTLPETPKVSTKPQKSTKGN